MPAALHRWLAVWTVASAAAAFTTAWSLPVALAPAAGLDRVLVRACAAVTTLAVAWLWAATGLTAVAALRGRQPHLARPGRRLRMPVSEVQP